MNEKWHGLTGLPEGSSADDGPDIRFAIELADAPPLHVETSYEEIGNIFQYLAYIAREAANKREKGLPAGTGRDLSPYRDGHISETDCARSPRWVR